MSFPSADFDRWLTTLPEETEDGYVESARFSEGFKPYDDKKLDARLSTAGLDVEARRIVLETVDEWLADMEKVWRTSFIGKALEFAETLSNLRKNSLRNNEP